MFGISAHTDTYDFYVAYRAMNSFLFLCFLSKRSCSLSHCLRSYPGLCTCIEVEMRLHKEGREQEEHDWNKGGPESQCDQSAWYPGRKTCKWDASCTVKALISVFRCHCRPSHLHLLCLSLSFPFLGGKWFLRPPLTILWKKSLCLEFSKTKLKPVITV